MKLNKIAVLSMVMVLLVSYVRADNDEYENSVSLSDLRLAFKILKNAKNEYKLMKRWAMGPLVSLGKFRPANSQSSIPSRQFMRYGK